MHTIIAHIIMSVISVRMSTDLIERLSIVAQTFSASRKTAFGVPYLQVTTMGVAQGGTVQDALSPHKRARLPGDTSAVKNIIATSNWKQYQDDNFETSLLRVKPMCVQLSRNMYL